MVLRHDASRGPRRAGQSRQVQVDTTQRPSTPLDIDTNDSGAALAAEPVTNTASPNSTESGLESLDSKSLSRLMMRAPDPEQRKAAARELRARQAAKQRAASSARAGAPEGPKVEPPSSAEAAPAAPAASAPVAVSVAALAQLDDARLSRAVLDLTPAERRSIARAVLADLDKMRRATARQPVMSNGKVVDYIKVPDYSARYKACDRLLKLVAADIPADRTPQAPVINIVMPSWLPAQQPEVIDVTAQEVKPLALPE